MKGILFKPDMIKAIVEWRKTQTRRVIKPQPEIIVDGNKYHFRWQETPSETLLGTTQSNLDGLIDAMKNKSRYQVGETVYIKEAWATIKVNDNLTPREIAESSAIFYTFGDNREGDDDDELEMERGKWRSPLFMPAWAARYFLKITDVRAERTRDITIEDCHAEGIWLPSEKVGYYGELYREAYFGLYDSINGKDAHKTNWDWVYSFKLETK